MKSDFDPSPRLLGEGADSAQETKVDSVDFASHNDRTMFLSATQRWHVPDEFKRRAVRALEYALALALRQEDHRAITGCVRCLAHIEQQNMADEHLKLNLAARGTPVDDLTVKVVYEAQPMLGNPYAQDDSDIGQEGQPDYVQGQRSGPNDAPDAVPPT